MTPMKLKALNDAARQEQPLLVAVAHDDEGQEVFRGAIVYADGGYFGIERDGGEVSEWPAELTRLEEAA